MCVTGHPLKNHDFWKIASSILSFRQFEGSKVANKHVCEKISCSGFSRTASTTSAERFRCLKSGFEHFGTSCLFWVQKGGTPRPRACGAHKARPVPGTAQANAEAENDEVPFFPAPAATFVSGLLHVQKSGPETHTIRQTESEFIGVGRREPAHGMQISCAGRGAAWPFFSLYVCL